MACAAALAVQRVLKRDRLVERCAQQGETLAARLRATFAEHPHVGDVRGRGLFRAVELVRDRPSKQPFDPAHRLAARIRAAAMSAGLLCYPMGGTIDGKHGDHVLLAPPFTISDDELDLLVGRLRQAIDGAIRALA
jgi:adenosylmethionine-8-amino-7-oxononanoate aminotransferase